MSKNITLTLPEDQLNELFDLVAESLMEFEDDLAYELDNETKAWHARAVAKYSAMYETIQTALKGDQA